MSVSGSDFVDALCKWVWVVWVVILVFMYVCDESKGVLVLWVVCGLPFFSFLAHSKVCLEEENGKLMTHNKVWEGYLCLLRNEYLLAAAFFLYIRVHIWISPMRYPFLFDVYEYRHTHTQ